MKKRNMITAAAFTVVFAAAMTVPVWASSVTEVEILQIDEQLDIETPESAAADDEAPRARASAPAAQSQPAQENRTGGSLSQEAAELSAQQRSVILELIPDDLYRFYTSRLWDAVPETSVNIDSLSASDLVNELYGVLRNAGRDSAIFTPVEHAAVEGYSVWFDKDDALGKVAGLYGRAVTEAAIAGYNDEWGGDMPDMIAVDGNAIASLNPEGEGKVYPSIQSCVMDGEDLIVSLSFTVTFEDSKNNGSGRATAVFSADPESAAGYRLKSIAMD